MSDASALFSDGKAYERLMGRWSRRAGDQFLDWLALPKGLRWLDVGCGNGAFTEAVIARGAPAEVDAVDPSEGQLDYARTRPGAKGARFRVADAQSLPFADRSFDAAVMALVISFVPDPFKAVNEMARVTRPGGCVATYMWDIPGGGLPLRPISLAMQSLGLGDPRTPGAEVTRQESMRALWEKAGLGSVETSAIRIQVEYSSFDDFWDTNSVPVGPSGKAVADLSPEKREELKAELRKQLSPGPDGRIAYNAHANAVKGRAP